VEHSQSSGRYEVHYFLQQEHKYINITSKKWIIQQILSNAADVILPKENLFSTITS